MANPRLADLDFDSDVDFGRIHRLEEEAREYIDAWVSEYDHPIVACSGGTDSLVISKLAYEAGIRDVVTVWTPEEYPKHKQYTRDALYERIGFDRDRHHVVEAPFDLEWLRENPHYVFPDYEHCNRFWDMRQRQHLMEFFSETHYDVRIMGRRTQENNVPDWVTQKAGQDQAFPIRYWKFEDVIGFLDKHNLGINPMYLLPEANRMGEGPWHLRNSDREPLDQLWWSVRDFATEEFWERIVGAFPEGIEYADTFEQKIAGGEVDLENVYDSGVAEEKLSMLSLETTTR